MRISYNWLKDYIDLNIDADELGRRYTAAGLELDETVSRAKDFSGVVVGRVLTCDPVEGSDHLHLCRIVNSHYLKLFVGLFYVYSLGKCHKRAAFKQFFVDFCSQFLDRVLLVDYYLCVTRS